MHICFSSENESDYESSPKPARSDDNQALSAAWTRIRKTTTILKASGLAQATVDIHQWPDPLFDLILKHTFTELLDLQRIDAAHVL